MNNGNPNKTIRNLSIAVFIMLACLFATSSCTELKKSHRKQNKLTGKRKNITAKTDEKINNSHSKNFTLGNIVEFPVKLNNNTEVPEAKINLTLFKNSNLKPKFVKVLNQTVRHPLKKFENKSSEDYFTEPEPLRSNGTEPFTNFKQIHKLEQNNNPDESEAPAEHEENADSSFLETKTTVQARSESELNLNQNTNQPSAFDNSQPAITSGNNNYQSPQSPKTFANQLQNPKDPFAYGNTKVKCTQVNCPYPSTCVADFVCRCGPDVANYFVDPLDQQNPTYYCVYSRKRQLVAFLLEFFIPPIGHFYAGQYLIATLKLVLPCVFALMFYLIQNTLAKGIAGAGICGMSVWWLVDIILYGMNKYADQNNVPLASW